MNYVRYIFPFIFIGMWILVTYIISKMGWDDLVEKFKVERKFSGRRIGIISASINSGNYQNAIILKYDERGFYLSPSILFRLFHPAVFIPWTEIKDVREKKIFLTKYTELIIGDPLTATITLKSKIFNRLKPEYKKAWQVLNNKMSEKFDQI